MMWLWFFIACFDSSSSSSNVQRFPVHQIQVNGKKYTVEFACKEHEVALGLRYRILEENEGAILCASSGTVTMKKMKSPISVAFISLNRKILSIHDLGLDDADLPIAPNTKWVWEMPKGWFEQNRIQEGMLIDGLLFF